jgi:hypothetical protein
MSESAIIKGMRRLGLLWLLACSLAAHAEAITLDPDWQESEAPAPPVFRADKLLPLEMPPYVSLKFGVDPASLAITPDGIVRYVVVASNSGGSVSAFYEGIRCATGEVKVYARATGPGSWTSVKEAKWRGLNDNQPSKHALVFARQGACVGATAVGSVAELIRAMNK